MHFLSRDAVANEGYMYFLAMLIQRLQYKNIRHPGRFHFFFHYFIFNEKALFQFERGYFFNLTTKQQHTH